MTTDEIIALLETHRAEYKEWLTLLHQKKRFGDVSHADGKLTAVERLLAIVCPDNYADDDDGDILEG